jgi:hypothetical protein
MLTLDLQQEKVALHDMLTDAVRQFVAKHRQAASTQNHPNVTRIDLIFSLSDGEATPWVHLNFDTKPRAGPDGDPTHPDFAKMSCDNWLPAVRAVCEGELVTVVGQDGKPREGGDADLTMAVGDFLVGILLEAPESGTFAALPMDAPCELGVEDPTTGEFGWPPYDERGETNLVS